MRILIFHGYLLRGTGSNVYNANLAPALARLGHEVHLLAQERHCEELGWVDAIGSWESGALRVAPMRDPVRVTVYRPEIHGLLPVYVADAYEGVEARPFPELDDAEVDRYVAANVAAVRAVVERADPEAALANHLVMGPAILRRALADTGVPYAVKIHGSALEYTVKPHPRFRPWAQEGLAGARGVLVGSRHVAESLWAVIGDADVVARTRLGPPGVDVAAFGPRPPGEAHRGLARLADRLAGVRADAAAPASSSFARDAGAGAAALRAVASQEEDRRVIFVGKLIVAKGIDLLLAAWPLVLARVPTARLVVVGFGAYRVGVEALVAALGAGDLDRVASIAREGRALEGGPRAPLAHLLAFLAGLEGAARAGYLAAARNVPDRVTLVGRLEHDELTELLPACEAEVVPSTFPEAFGMVAAEAAACGVLPVCAAHSGLAEVSAVLAEAVPLTVRDWLTFPVGPGAVQAIAERLVAWLLAPAEVRDETRRALVRTARERYSWEGVARGVLAAAQGELDGLPRP